MSRKGQVRPGSFAVAISLACTSKVDRHFDFMFTVRQRNESGYIHTCIHRFRSQNFLDLSVTASFWLYHLLLGGLRVVRQSSRRRHLIEDFLMVRTPNFCLVFGRWLWLAVSTFRTLVWRLELVVSWFLYISYNDLLHSPDHFLPSAEPASSPPIVLRQPLSPP